MSVWEEFRKALYREENMEELVLETVEDDGVDDLGTIKPGQEEGEPEYEAGVYPASNIKIDRVQYSIFELKRRYDKGTICLDPDFQRGFVWKPRQKSELIESVIMGIPLPLIYMAETMEGKLVIVDGRQRLTTFFDFMDNKFALSGLRILSELNKDKFEDLERDEKKRKFAVDIEDFQLVIQIIKYPTPDRVRFDIFDRVNRGGTPLNNQEMRNALYQGKSTRLLNVLASMEEFKAATGHSISSTHMKDKYIILRAVSFYLWKRGRLKKKDGGLAVYRSDMEEFLGISMEYLNRASDKEIREIEQLFRKVMTLSRQILGEDGFRIPTDSGRRRPVSMTLFESLFYFIALLLESESEYEPAQLSEAVSEMLEDSAFLNALTYNVDSASHVECRLRVVDTQYGRLEAANQAE